MPRFIDAPKSIIENGIVVNHEQLVRYWRDRHFREDRIRRGNFYALKDTEEDTQPEAKPIFRPRPIDNEIDQLKAGFLFLQGKINNHIDKSKKKPQSKWG